MIEVDAHYVVGPNLVYSVSASPLANIVEHEIAGFRAYSCSSIDPQMLICESETGLPVQLVPGHYRFLFHPQISRGRIETPKIYLDLGGGFSEAENCCFRLDNLGSGVWCCNVSVDRTAIAVRFDPSDVAVRFAVLRLLIWGRDVELPEMPMWRRWLLSALKAFGGDEASARWRIVHSIAAKFYASEPSETKRSAFNHAAVVALTKSQTFQSVQPSTSDSVYAAAYARTVSTAHGSRSPHFAPHRATPVQVSGSSPRVIAFYLPQFHPFPENDEWWGRGFTEWTNVGKAVPQFLGHYQPRLPGELGYYDLRLKEVIQRQIELAKQYGVNGFCFHYYWFEGHRLLERPVDLFLSQKDREFDHEFCLCWANENWTRRWDGAEDNILMKQNHTEEDNRRIFADLLRYISDPRYVRINGKPVILVYRPSIIPQVADMALIWREEAEKAGLPGLFLVATTAFGFDTPEEIGFDALCMFPPHAVSVGEITTDVEMLNPNFQGKIYDYGQTVEAFQRVLEEKETGVQKKPTWPCVMTGWDNEARKPGRGHVFHNATPQKFYDWFSSAIDWSKSNHAPGERMVFVNAWNEWAEGTYLEPDRHFGYAYLQAIAAKRSDECSNKANLDAFAIEVNQKMAGRKGAQNAVLIHVFYPDLADEFAEALSRISKIQPLDAVISIPDTFDVATARAVVEKLKPVRLVVCQNRGRDIWPFLESLRAVEGLGYVFGCKLHSKKSLHLSRGDLWRRSLLDSLLGPEAARNAFKALNFDARVGLVAPEEAFMSATNADAMRDNRDNIEAILKSVGKDGVSIDDFVAGTMFWFRFKAISPIAAMPMTAEDFGPELGAIDGTVAHAFERVIPTLVKLHGFSVGSYKSASINMPY